MKASVTLPAIHTPAPAPASRAQAQADQRPAAVAQRQALAALDASPRQVAQRQRVANHQVVQRVGWGWNPFASSESSGLLASEAEQKKELEKQERERRAAQNKENFDNVAEEGATTIPQKVEKGLGVGQKLASLGGMVGSGLYYMGEASGKAVRSGFGAAGITGTASALFGALNGAYGLVTGRTQPVDKATAGLDVVSNLGQMAASSSSTTSHIAASLGHTIAPRALALTGGIGGMVSGGADLLSGGINAWKAQQRLDNLREIDQQARNKSEWRSGVSRMAQEAQVGKRRQNIGKAFTGSMTMLGGGALTLGALGYGAAATNPLGWGLMGIAAATKAGFWGYNKYKQHHEANNMMNDQPYLDSLSLPSQVKDNAGVESNYSLLDLPSLPTKAMRRQDNLRRNVAKKLGNPYEVEQGQQQDNILTQLGLAGQYEPHPADDQTNIRRGDNTREIYRALLPE